MSFAQRLVFFIIGIALGSVFVGYIMQQRRAAAGHDKQVEAALAPVGAEAVQRAAVSGIMRAYNQRQVPMQSEYIKNEVLVADEPRPGFTERYLLLRGMEPEQVLLIREVSASDADKVWGQLEEVRIMAADRVQVRTAPDVSRPQFEQALAAHSMHIVRGLSPEASEDPSAPVEVTVPEGTLLQTPADVAETNLYLVGFPLFAADSALKASIVLTTLDEVASIDFDYLDAATPFFKRGS